MHKVCLRIIQKLTIIIDYNGSQIGVPRVDKSIFTIYPNPSSSNIFITGVNISNIQVLDLCYFFIILDRNQIQQISESDVQKLSTIK